MVKNKRTSHISKREEAKAEKVIKAVFIVFMALALTLLLFYAIYA
ncbi:MAG: hypothetical protein ACRCZY_08465 [Phocaeicola sp.]